MFDEKTKEHLKYYVYLLIDPTSNEPFYVGKGKNNRVFDHINQEIEGEYESLKYQEIQRIGPQNVKHIIVRHGLSESAAFAQFNTSLYRLCKSGLLYIDHVFTYSNHLAFFLLFLLLHLVALYLVFLFGCYIVSELERGNEHFGWLLATLTPLLLFILYLAFKPIKKPLR